MKLFYGLAGVVTLCVGLVAMICLLVLSPGSNEARDQRALPGSADGVSLHDALKEFNVYVPERFVLKFALNVSVGDALELKAKVPCDKVSGIVSSSGIPPLKEIDASDSEDLPLSLVRDSITNHHWPLEGKSVTYAVDPTGGRYQRSIVIVSSLPGDRCSMYVAGGTL